MIRRKFSEFAGVVAGGTATLQLPLGLTYHSILLSCTATGTGAFDNTKVNEIRLILNEKVVYRVPGAKLKKIHAYKGGDSSTRFLLVDFTERDAKDITGELSGIIGTAAGVSQMVLEVDIDATGTNPVLTARGLVSPGTALSSNVHTLTKRTFTCGGAGEFTIQLPKASDLAGTADRLLKRVFLFDQAGGNLHTVVSKVVGKKNGVDIYYAERAEEDFIQAHYNGVPDNAMHVVDFVLTNNTLPELVSTRDAQECELIITTTGAVTFEYYVESLADIRALG